MKPIPRLSRALRAFTNLSCSSGAKTDTAHHLNELRVKRKEERNDITWSSLYKKLEESGKNPAEIRSLLNPLCQIARPLAGDESSQQVVEECAVWLLIFFLTKTNVGPRELNGLKENFGNADLPLCKEIQKIISNIAKNLPDNVKQFLAKDVSEDSIPLVEFGRDFKVTCADDTVHMNGIGDVLINWGGNGTETNGIVSKEFSFKWEDPVIDKPIETRVFERKVYGRGWLENQLITSSSISALDLVDAVMAVVCSSRSDEELQNELFDLLGFERIELVEQVLQHRPEMKKSEKSLMTQVAMATKPKPTPCGPIVSGQVVVQSHKELQLMKEMRREEKRFQKLRQNYDDDMEEVASKRMFQQEQALANASTLPILKYTGARKEKYPNVFDSLAETRQTASFVAGSKMVLPSAMKRTNTNQYEEINIPLTDPAPTEVGNTLIPVASLDEISRKAFGNCKNLNKIQSVVFETAYRTNENMLICAPTGAGKTNIAMLTILHQIKQYIRDNGMLEKDKFKIVYVAPMKALAAEMAENFGKRLAPLGVQVRELTGDMQLTKTEIMETQMLITTPEKWDVITRKSTGDIALTQLVKLLIIDEVHLLHGDRGPVVEALVARTLRQVESSQTMIRIVGLSATLPNYVDVAQFLRVNLYKGLFYFDSRFRPVPLSQTFIGVKEVNPMRQMQEMDKICYDKVAAMVQQGHQVMVFVHARNATLKTAMNLRELAQQKNQLHMFQPEDNTAFGMAMRTVSKSRNKHFVDLFKDGFAIHHAGMLRSDRNLVEKVFSDGMARVLVCTATLAWGVNLPAHAVVIKGTEIYDAKHGAFVDLGILDVLQIFGRAGRPQFDKSGHGTIITSHDKLAFYLSLLTCQYPIESSFEKSMTDNLNAEISLGTVTNVDEAVQWLSYTYLFIRMKKNPQAYGIGIEQVFDDPQLGGKRRDLIVTAARLLDKTRMIRFEERTGMLHATDLGRTASHFYIKYDTVEIFNNTMHPCMNDGEIFALISTAQEFDQLKVRDDELDELDDYMHTYCELPVSGGSENVHGKVNILLQTYVSRGILNSFSLISDQSFIAQNAGRICRALFEIGQADGNKATTAGAKMPIGGSSDRSSTASAPTGYNGLADALSDGGGGLAPPNLPPPPPPSYTDSSDSSDDDRPLIDGEGMESGEPLGPAPQCPLAHDGRQMLSMTVPIGVDDLFTLLFTNSSFFMDFLQTTRKSTDLQLGQWQEAEHNPAEKVRTVAFNLPLNGVNLGVKTTRTTETQTLLEMSRAGDFYAVNVDVCNSGVPYSDTFYVACHYCILRCVAPTSGKQSRLVVHCQVKYRKSVWGIVKTFIEKNAWSGLEENFSQLKCNLQLATQPAPSATGSRGGGGVSDDQETGGMLQPKMSLPALSVSGSSSSASALKHARRHTTQQSHHHPHARLRRHGRVASIGKDGDLIALSNGGGLLDHPSVMGASGKVGVGGDVSQVALRSGSLASGGRGRHSAAAKLSASSSQTFSSVASSSSPSASTTSSSSSISILSVIFISLVLLLCTNGFLFSKIWALERLADQLAASASTSSSCPGGGGSSSLTDLRVMTMEPKSPEEWMRILRQQETIYRSTESKWLSALSSVNDHLKQTQDTLALLEKDVMSSSQEPDADLIRAILEKLQQLHHPSKVSSVEHDVAAATTAHSSSSSDRNDRPTAQRLGDSSDDMGS